LEAEGEANGTQEDRGEENPRDHQILHV